jgi:hypothetical protein
MSGLVMPRSVTLPAVPAPVVPAPAPPPPPPPAPPHRFYAWENLSDAVGVTSMLLGLALCALAIAGG